MARLSKQATKSRDDYEEAQIQLGAAELELQQVQLRVGQAHDRHGLVDLMGPAFDAGQRAVGAIRKVRKLLKESYRQPV